LYVDDKTDTAKREKAIKRAKKFDNAVTLKPTERSSNPNILRSICQTASELAMKKTVKAVKRGKINAMIFIA
jgi:hypothetical protein